MTERKMSQKGFVAVTLITVLAIALVLVVYATLLATIPGEEVVVGSLTGNVQYSLTDSNLTADFSTTVSPAGPSTAWYARLVTTGGEYTGPISVSWQLQKYSGTWGNVGAPVSTSFTLTTGPDTIYASANGQWTATGQNQNWGAIITAQGTGSGSYRVVATISTTPP